MGALARVPLHRDVRPALERLRAAGLPAFALTNGSAAFVRGILDSAGVTDALVDMASVDAVGHGKLRPEP